ncbi:Nucleoside-diphosphate-sugar epimerase [Actinopolymorpha cephalotaxi]|uniref:Nucleoside-diphosphate-sugar epimerase n=1 Tax=Actinopolymorpha cephalotaxi TaxID=504797 RepID=A0A1I2SPW1_9ACTN|nr:Nucleoside-diphosphate-sugar epimerase [Actinopolymorpha cephalotaxi]
MLGGTKFVGREVVYQALSCGWAVTTFNRGRSGEDPVGVQAIRGDRSVEADVSRLAECGPWDAVVDTSAYVPRNMLAVARRLEPVASRYVLISTVSVYAGWPVEPLSEDSPLLVAPPDAGPDFGEDTEDGPTQYGYQKAGTEAAVKDVFGSERTTVLRPGVVLGPGEYVGRLPWWLRRAAAGGRVVAPAPPQRSIQPVDVRDLAAFALRCVEHGTAGAFNVTAPIGRETFGGLLTACAQATGGDPEYVWIPDEALLEAGVRQWSELPLWRTFEGVWRVDSTPALRAGLDCRPLAETVRDTWQWLVETGAEQMHERAVELGLSPERERELLAMVGGSN